MGLTLTVDHQQGAKEELLRNLKRAGPAVYVGIPATNAQDRIQALMSMAAGASGRQRKRLRRMAEQDVNNAELLWIFSKGSPARNQPPRPVLEPAIEADGNRQPIARELGEMARAHMAGDAAKELQYAHRAALAGQNACRDWFTDPRNHWKPNAPATIRQKGSDRPGIDIGIMRSAIVGVVEEGK